MLLSVLLLASPLAGLALSSSPYAPSFDLSKRQSTSFPSESEVDSLLDGWQNLLAQVGEVMSPTSDSSCKETCLPYYQTFAGCSNEPTTTEGSLCACDGNTLETMMACASCIGSEEQTWGKGMERVCTEVVSTLDISVSDSNSNSSSSASSGTASSANAAPTTAGETQQLNGGKKEAGTGNGAVEVAMQGGLLVGAVGVVAVFFSF